MEEVPFEREGVSEGPVVTLTGSNFENGKGLTVTVTALASGDQCTYVSRYSTIGSRATSFVHLYPFATTYGEHAGVVVSGLDPHDTDWVSGTVAEIGVSAKMERDKEKSGGKTLS